MNKMMNNASSRNPMELVERYLQAIRFWLPKTQRQDLTADLAEDLHSQIDEKESELGRPLDEAEISAVLKRCGNPIVVASRLRPQRYLIGPTLFPVYEFVLRTSLLWILLPIFIFILGPVNLANTHGEWGLAMGRTMGNFWSAIFPAAGIITIVFALLERTHKQFRLVDKWEPHSLPPLQKEERLTSFVRSVCELAFGWFGLIWLLLLPHYPVLILGPAAAFLKAAPVWHIFYVPILLLAILGLARAGLILAKPQWTAFPLGSQLLQTVLTLLLVSCMIVATHISKSEWLKSDWMQGDWAHSGWRPFFVVADGLQNSLQTQHVAAIVNYSIVICLLAVVFGLCIAGIIQLCRFIHLLIKRISGAHQPASLAQ